MECAAELLAEACARRDIDKLTLQEAVAVERLAHALSIDAGEILVRAQARIGGLSKAMTRPRRKPKATVAP